MVKESLYFEKLIFPYVSVEDNPLFVVTWDFSRGYYSIADYTDDLNLKNFSTNNHLNDFIDCEMKEKLRSSAELKKSLELFFKLDKLNRGLTQDGFLNGSDNDPELNYIRNLADSKYDLSRSLEIEDFILQNPFVSAIVKWTAYNVILDECIRLTETYTLFPSLENHLTGGIFDIFKIKAERKDEFFNPNNFI